MKLNKAFLASSCTRDGLKNRFCAFRFLRPFLSRNRGFRTCNSKTHCFYPLRDHGEHFQRSRTNRKIGYFSIWTRHFSSKDCKMAFFGNRSKIEILKRPLLLVQCIIHCKKCKGGTPKNLSISGPTPLCQVSRLTTRRRSALTALGCQQRLTAGATGHFATGRWPGRASPCRPGRGPGSW